MAKSFDTIVIGAGIMGLWAARHAIKSGRSVLVLEKRRIGAGASGGFLGALMPHMPDRWNAKKQMQYDALVALETAVQDLECETGISCGYRRSGRLMPLKHEKLVGIAEERKTVAEQFWLGEDGKPQFEIELLKPGFAGTIAQDWLSEEIAPYGASYDTLSARINPQRYIEAMAASIKASGEIREGADVVDIDCASRTLTLECGSKLAAQEIVIANGWEAYDLLKGINSCHLSRPITGRGVKGQAVLLSHQHGDDQPIIYDDGSYIIPHQGRHQGRYEGKLDGDMHDNHEGNDLVAIGSTSVNDWQKAGDSKCATNYDEENCTYLDYARKLCPSLVQAPVIKKWANIRPRNTMADLKTGKIVTDPVFGSIDGHQAIKLAIGGFKISFGVAHWASKDLFL